MTGFEPFMHRADAILAADADREAIAEILRIGAGEGRIDFDELDERVGLAYGARTYGQLRVLVADLPVHPAIEPEALSLRTTESKLSQSGRWAVPRRITAESTTGRVTIDFTQASCPHHEITVEAATWAGLIRLNLPDGWAARVHPSSSNTSHIRNEATPTAGPGAPTVLVIGQPVYG